MAPRVTSSARFDAAARGVSANEVRAVVLNAKKEAFPLSTWGKRVKHSQGKECLCSHCKINSTLAASSSAYSGVYPATPAVLAVPTGTWRDGEGVVIEVHPVSVDHAKGAVEVLHGADIKWGMTLTTEDHKPLVVDPAFYDAYSHVFDNGEHQAQTDRQTDRETGRERDRQRDRQTDRQK